jgi:hypothetical protein
MADESAPYDFDGMQDRDVAISYLDGTGAASDDPRAVRNRAIASVRSRSAETAGPFAESLRARSPFSGAPNQLTARSDRAPEY